MNIRNISSRNMFVSIAVLWIIVLALNVEKHGILIGFILTVLESSVLHILIFTLVPFFTIGSRRDVRQSDGE